ncbi:MAG: pyruvate:ferredoxin (flavodoxin) oxidoreductase [Christensenellales bacterium]|jgi:pyruvate-ferredoxin/flavodoxin oxidoreductase
MDGNMAAAYVSYAFTDVAAIYPITPSSQMAESVDEWAAQDKKNLFGQPVRVKVMQSEGGAAGTLHGVLQGGALATTYTASQGLLLMIPNMYKIAGELLPCVFHVSARSLASNALSIFGDHQDVMSTRQTGFALLASSSVQQCMDLGAVAHLSAIESRIPFLHFFDGFRTSHEMQKIDVLDYDDLAALINHKAVDEFRARALNPDNPVLRGTTQNPDVFFQMREATNKFYLDVPTAVVAAMEKINAITGRNYGLFNYHGHEAAEHVVIAMGSACETIRETVDYLNAIGEKAGVLEVHLYRPFSAEHFLGALPQTVKKIAVLDRTKEPGAIGEPLYLDVRNAFYERETRPVIVGGRYGLASKDFYPEDAAAVFENLKQETPRNGFTVGIVDDVTHTSLPAYPMRIDSTPSGVTACKFWGLGSDGTVSANKSAIKIIGGNTDMYAQAYFAYDSKKSGGLTVSHLRFGDSPIQSPYPVTKADYIACHNQAYVGRYDLLQGIKKRGKFLLNCLWKEAELEERLPAVLKRSIAENEVDFYTINAVEIARQIGLGGRINMIMQAAFFKLVGILPMEEAIRLLEDEVEKAYGKQGLKVVEMNFEALRQGSQSIKKISYPKSWQNAEDAAAPQMKLPEFVEKIIEPMNRQQGDLIPVSAFNGREDGTHPTGITQWEKRGIAIETPRWIPENCIQCNQCAFVCPHAVIRPLLLDEAQRQAAPSGFDCVAATGYSDRHYALAISTLDCTGCGICVETCPAKQKALEMAPLIANDKEQSERWEFAKNIENSKLIDSWKINVKSSQFLRPLLEFSGACAGCGETPYAKLITQLYGERMMISNAAGCSTVWGGSPAVSYTKNKRGHGPAWGFSLFEDNAEYGYGMLLGVDSVRNMVLDDVRSALLKDISDNLKKAMKAWVNGFAKQDGTRQRADDLAAALENEESKTPLLQKIYGKREYFVKRSHWVFGGDGWAYDIGYGGLDHVLASGDDINVLVFDTEVYSNTGGQSSKATPTAAVAQFAADGKKTKKKDLGLMAITYGYVYVAQVAMGANKEQTLRAIREAEAYKGPSLIIAYAPCVNHGIKGGMAQSQNQMKRAVKAGYWSLYRYNPQLKEQGKNPFILDSAEPSDSFEEFLMSEVRYSALYKRNPGSAKGLFEKAKEDAMERYDAYKRLAGRER